jgi:superfamily I DNA/RNA helicase
VLVYRARLFAELYPQQRFLVTCYTRSLSSQLRLLLADWDNIDVKNLDALKQQAIKDRKLDAPSYKEDPDGERIAAVAVKALELGALPRYRAVFVDEAQDFGTNSLIFARMLVNPKSDDLLIVADAAQNIFRRKFSWKQAGISAQGRTRILRVNYRNTREILELANSFLLNGGSLHSESTPDVEDENAVIPPEAAARSGAEPTVALCDESHMVSSVVDAARAQLGKSRKPKSVAVLYIGSQGAALARTLRSVGLDYFWVTDPQKQANRTLIAEATEPVILSTVYSAKGMEFPSVVLSCTPRDVEQDLEELRRAIYVGMTRATERLTVFAGESHPLADDLKRAAEEKGRLRVELPEEEVA